ncbi:MAG TPA: 16S rRNA (guanine(966)-N(2))-methyltransferase RsmD [Candidatus Limnocylindria bacterium]|nr:16S rRNA (guanine(966)-N(2))-methyltransferase RsmD [Candidatus Limnocylindria bacterium]
MPDAGRVVTGTAKGLRLAAPGEGTRPLSDRLKQGLFGSLAADTDVLDGGAFLDLYAGSGAAGIEALSRGAGRTLFLEHDAGACRVIADNLRRAGLAGGRVVRADVLRHLANVPPEAEAFDACLADPPYNQPLMEPTLELLGASPVGWLRPAAVVVAKHFWRDAPPDQVGRLRAYRRRRQGETMLSFYRLHEPDEAQED